MSPAVGLDGENRHKYHQVKVNKNEELRLEKQEHCICLNIELRQNDREIYGPGYEGHCCHTNEVDLKSELRRTLNPLTL